MSDTRILTMVDGPDIPGYRVVRHLGEGGMADVYLAVQLSLQRPVALKVLTFEKAVSEEVAERFEREARTIARLDHPHIVGIYEVGRTHEGRLFYVMPFLPNGDLSQRDLREDPAKILDVLRAVCEALKYAHAHSVVHRDVKPENILFDKTDRPLLTDFGIALSLGHDHRVTGRDKTLGSTGYMSPEQARGHDIDGRADIYSLGIVCYEMLTGELPFSGPDALSVAIAHMEDPVPRLPPTKRVWQPLLDRALAKSPDDRFQNAGEVLVQLAEIEQALKAPPPRGLPRLQVPRLQLPAIALWNSQRARMALLGALLAIALFALWVHLDEQRNPAGAEPATSVAQQGGPAEPAIDVIDAANFDRELAEAYALIGKGQLVEPAEANAAAKFLALLRTMPESSEARAGLDAVVAAMGKRAAGEIRAGRGAAAATVHEQTYALAQWSRIPDYEAFAKFEQEFAKAAIARLDQALAAHDTASVAPLMPAYEIAARTRPEVREKLAALKSAPQAGAKLRDPGGPALIVVPASHAGSTLDHGFALGAFEVTRGQFGEFARATSRAGSACRDSSGVFSFLRRPDWRDPGFKQTDTEPVVCVSADDAVAYADWLSARTGKRYRLPVLSEWQHVTRNAPAATEACRYGNVLDRSGESGVKLGERYGCSDGHMRTAPVGRFAATTPGIHDLAGNVREWLMDCSKRGGAGCAARNVAGSSFRDGADKPLVGGVTPRDADVGAPDIGFRVVRELDPP